MKPALRSILILTALLAIVAGALFMAYHIICYDVLDRPSDFGTLYGGVLGTIATIFGFYFIYNSYRSQGIEKDFALINELYADLQEDINTIQYRKRSRQNPTGILFEGIDALYNYNADDADSQNSVLNQLNLVVISFTHLAAIIKKSNFKDEETRSIMYDKLYLLYNSKVFWPVYQGIYMKHKEVVLLSRWGSADILFFKFELFAKKTFDYLIRRNIITRPLTSEQGLLSILDFKYESQAEWLKNADNIAKEVINDRIREAYNPAVWIGDTLRSIWPAQKQFWPEQELTRIGKIRAKLGRVFHYIVS